MQQLNGQQTIFALSSGKLPSGVAVVRLSGPQVAAVVVALTGSLPKPRMASLRSLNAKDGRLLDNALIVWFPAPKSFTGEDCCEFHCHGGPAVVAALLSELAAMDGCRQAEAGEFSLRAFTSGKTDLTQMESLADLVSAETESQRALAIKGASGASRGLYESWRADLLNARAMIEADLDFSDEDDVPGSVAEASIHKVRLLVSGVERHLNSARSAEIIRHGFRVVIAGSPNVGKSTLLNTLAKRDVAIVTDIAGTTRDVLEIALDLDGFKIMLLDTAGLRDTSDKVEKIGIERARIAISDADLVLLLSDNDEFEPLIARNVLKVTAKCDDDGANVSGSDFCISCKTGRGLNELLAAISGYARDEVGNWAEGEVATHARHVALLNNAMAALVSFEDALNNGAEFGAEHLRVAAECLALITGVISTEDVLGEIFSAFCIGK